MMICRAALLLRAFSRSAEPAALLTVLYNCEYHSSVLDTGLGNFDMPTTSIFDASRRQNELTSAGLMMMTLMRLPLATPRS